jgi:hypothetical protein
VQCWLDVTSAALTSVAAALPSFAAAAALLSFLCRLYKEVVDELLAEVAGEVLTSAAAADAFSSDMLVAAVAFSTGK